MIFSDGVEKLTLVGNGAIVRFRIFLSILCLTVLTACHQSELQQGTATDTRPALTQTSAPIPVAYAGENLRFNIRCKAADFKLAKSAEVSLENGVPNVLSDAYISSAKATVPLKASGTSMIVDVPTTADFQPGIWHIKEIVLLLPNKQKSTLVEGKDFNGFPLLLVNAQKIQSQEPELQIVNVESKAP